MRESFDNLKYYFNSKNDVIVFALPGESVLNLLSPGIAVPTLLS